MSGIDASDSVGSATLHATIFCTIGLCATVLVMSFLFKIDVVARGQGKVVPITRVQVIQSEYPGRIAAIKVENGMSVAEGDILIEFDATAATAEFDKVQTELDRLAIEAARIDALVSVLSEIRDGSSLLDTVESHFSLSEALLKHPLAVEHRIILKAELEDYIASLAQISAREVTYRKSEAVTSANIQRLAATMEIQAKRLRIADQLRQQGTTSMAAFLDVQQAFIELELQRDVYLAELDQKAAERAALDSERLRIIANLKSTYLKRKAEVDARLATLTEEAKTVSARLAAATLRAPTSGVVDRLSVFTIGGVAEAGAELMRVVPTEIAVEIEGTFLNSDIGFLAEGQQANIRLDAYPSERFGFLKGRVTDIAADSAEVGENQWAYLVRITPDQPFLTAGNDQFSLRPGMTATIDVNTDNRRIISYFFAPIVRTIEDAMGER
jgi:hemolysin D